MLRWLIALVLLIGTTCAIILGALHWRHTEGAGKANDRGAAGGGTSLHVLERYDPTTADEAQRLLLVTTVDAQHHRQPSVDSRRGRLVGDPTWSSPWFRWGGDPYASYQPAWKDERGFFLQMNGWFIQCSPSLLWHYERDQPGQPIVRPGRRYRCGSGSGLRDATSGRNMKNGNGVRDSDDINNGNDHEYAEKAMRWAPGHAYPRFIWRSSLTRFPSLATEFVLDKSQPGAIEPVLRIARTNMRVAVSALTDSFDPCQFQLSSTLSCQQRGAPSLVPADMVSVPMLPPHLTDTPYHLRSKEQSKGDNIRDAGRDSHSLCNDATAASSGDAPTFARWSGPLWPDVPKHGQSSPGSGGSFFSSWWSRLMALFGSKSSSVSPNNTTTSSTTNSSGTSHTNNHNNPVRSGGSATLADVLLLGSLVAHQPPDAQGRVARSYNELALYPPGGWSNGRHTHEATAEEWRRVFPPLFDDDTWGSDDVPMTMAAWDDGNSSSRGGGATRLVLRRQSQGGASGRIMQAYVPRFWFQAVSAHPAMRSFVFDPAHVGLRPWNSSSTTVLLQGEYLRVGQWLGREAHATLAMGLGLLSAREWQVGTEVFVLSAPAAYAFLFQGHLLVVSGAGLILWSSRNMPWTWATHAHIEPLQVTLQNTLSFPSEWALHGSNYNNSLASGHHHPFSTGGALFGHAAGYAYV